MHRYLILCGLALAGCSQPIEYLEIRPVIPAELLVPCAGWTGGPAVTEGDVLRIVSASEAGRICANNKLAAVALIAMETSASVQDSGDDLIPKYRRGG